MRWLRYTAWGFGGLVVLLVAAFVLLQTPPGLRTLGYLVSSSDITVKGLGGFIPTDLHVERVELRDKDGIWLSLDDAQVRWSFSSLFTGRVRVEEVKAAKIDVVRLPLPTEQAVKSSSSRKFGIPVGVDIDALSVDDLHVGPALGVVDSHWKLAGSGLLTADGSASRFKLDMNRTDGPAAQLAVDLGFSLDRFSVDGTIAATESSKGGLVAALIGRPDLDGMSVKLIAKGDRSQGTAELVSGAGDAVTSNGGIRWQREGNATVASVNLSLVGPGLPDSPIARLLRRLHRSYLAPCRVLYWAHRFCLHTLRPGRASGRRLTASHRSYERTCHQARHRASSKRCAARAD